jgi:hypothetical protein
MKNQYEVYRIISNNNNKPQGVYSRAYHDEYDFESISEARDSNFNGIYKDKNKYRIAKYKVTYELIDDDCDPITEEELIKIKKDKEENIEFEKQYEKISMELFNRHYCDLTFEEQLHCQIVDLYLLNNLGGNNNNENKIL